jgi:shikimate 5-dehydrogenase
VRSTAPSSKDHGERDVLIDARGVSEYEGPPLYLFIGISTAGSSVQRLFPRWTATFAPSGVLRGVDLPDTAPAQAFRALVVAMRDNPYVAGAVITSHKLRLYHAIHDLVEPAEPLVQVTHEINSLDTRSGLVAYARDPQSLDVILDTTGGPGVSTTRPVYCIGSGGAAVALLLAMGLDIPASISQERTVTRSPGNARGPLTIIGRSPESLQEVRDVQERANLLNAPIKLVRATTPTDIAGVIRQAPEGSVVINATGLGKLSADSPLAGPGDFPKRVLAWDFNYRGPLTFLQQASRAGLATEDGWEYFLAGWAAALAAISGGELTVERLTAIRAASGELQP